MVTVKCTCHHVPHALLVRENEKNLTFTRTQQCNNKINIFSWLYFVRRTNFMYICPLSPPLSEIQTVANIWTNTAQYIYEQLFSFDKEKHVHILTHIFNSDSVNLTTFLLNDLHLISSFFLTLLSFDFLSMPFAICHNIGLQVSYSCVCLLYFRKYCGVLRHCRHRSDGLILYSQSQSHVVTIPYDYFLHGYKLLCWLFSPWRLSSSGSNIYISSLQLPT
jgi:hypothetical protein